MIIKTKSQITFVGGGKMAEAIFAHIIAKDILIPQEINVLDISDSRLDYLYKTYGVKTAHSTASAIDSDEPVIIAVKPQDMETVLKEISKKPMKNLVISIAAGIKTEYIEKYLPNARIIRAMPNSAALVSSAISALSRGSKASKEDLEAAKEIFATIGEVIEVKEDLQDSITALSGSGPAYFFYLTELLEEAGVSIGLSKENSQKLATQIAIGAGGLLETGKSPKELRKMVTSPEGTTEAAIKSFEESKLSNIVKKAVQKARERSRELSKS